MDEYVALSRRRFDIARLHVPTYCCCCCCCCCCFCSASGLYPTDDLAAAKIDAIMDCSADLSLNIRPSFMEQDTAKKVNAHMGHIC